MNRRVFGRSALNCGVAAAALAGCSVLWRPFDSAHDDMNRTLPTGRSVQTHSGPAYTVIYNFGAYPTDGVNPEARLTDAGGILYGTTISGGSECYASGGCGTVFSLTTSGAESILHSFGGAEDGALPYAGLMKAKDVLYGTTAGGASSGGTIFSITTSGAETVLYRFKGVPDGSHPHGGLVDIGGTLYGTTVYGGRGNAGTVYKISTGDKETVVHSFAGSHKHGGRFPEARLLNVNGTLYGTTYEGGVAKNRGTVFAITPSGKESVLHTFQGGERDGAYPRAGLIYVNGILYGTSTGGGNGGCKGCGYHEHFGTVFAITPSGSEKIIYRFKGYPDDGAVPGGELLYRNGTFYGTTEFGGANCAISHGCGTVFSLTPSGSERVLYSFLPKNGAHPAAGLIEVNGTFYGTTPDGGTSGEGTVYALTP
jgi:uncharacterized repeat protein (TIGR03803 family)